MPPTRQPHDPFTDAPLRPTTSNATSLSANPSTLHTQTSQHSLRSNTSTTSARPRQPRDLFAPALSRRGTTPRFEDEVLADSDSEQDVTTRQPKNARRVRHGSPDAKFARGKSKQDEEQESFVNRKADGTYLLGVAGFGDSVAVPQMTLPKTEEEREQEAVDAHYVDISRQYFTSGAALGGMSTKKFEEELEQLKLPMMVRLRQQAMQQLEDERWKYEATPRAHAYGL